VDPSRALARDCRKSGSGNARIKSALPIRWTGH
jgi:hypothetical protein